MQLNCSLFQYGLITGILTGALAGFLGAKALPSADLVSQATARTYHASPPPGAYTADILRIIDGDTVEARVSVWLDQTLTVRVRLRGVDAPELKGACAFEKAMASSAREALTEFAAGKQVTLTHLGPDKYFGRVVASLSLPDGSQAEAMLLERKLARPYDGGRRASWCERGVPVAQAE